MKLMNLLYDTFKCFTFQHCKPDDICVLCYTSGTTGKSLENNKYSQKITFKF